MRRLLLVVLPLFLACAAAAGEERIPIFDAHLHYNSPDWSVVTPEAVVRTLDAARVRGALVSSTPDDGSVRLLEHAPNRFVAELRPYRGSIGGFDWHSDPAVPAYVEERLKLGVHRGIGEIHLYTVAAASGPSARAVLEIARRRGLWLHIHAPAAALRAYLGDNPGVRVIWAHAGMSDPPAVIGQVMDDYPDLVGELSFREDDIAGEGNIVPAWRDLLTRYSGRSLVGSDTYITERWLGYGSLVDAHRWWLRALPREVAEAIAWKNAVRLFDLTEMKGQ